MHSVHSDANREGLLQMASQHPSVFLPERVAAIA